MDSSSFSSSSFSSFSYGSLITSDPEAGFSGATSSSSIPRSATMLGSPSSSRPGRLFSNGFDDDDDEDYEPRHFLDSCSLCRKPLARNCDIFMYRGDTPFCSEECRRERIEIDEAKEKSWKRLSVKASISRSKKEEEEKLQKEKKIHVRASTVVAG